MGTLVTVEQRHCGYFGDSCDRDGVGTLVTVVIETVWVLW